MAGFIAFTLKIAGKKTNQTQPIRVFRSFNRARVYPRDNPGICGSMIAAGGVERPLKQFEKHPDAQLRKTSSCWQD
jgi:hypothetical protein